MESASTDGRTARRVAAMRRIQLVALRLFERRGFDNVTVDDIAQQAKVGVATVYRNFGTKERMVLWDEYDPLVFAALEGQPRPGLAAIREAFLVSLDQIYKTDRQRILRRARLVAETPALAQASVHDLHALRSGLSQLLRRTGPSDALERDVIAFAVVAALEAALAQWLRLAGRRRLGTLLDKAFRTLGDLRI